MNILWLQNHIDEWQKCWLGFGSMFLSGFGCHWCYVLLYNVCKYLDAYVELGVYTSTCIYMCVYKYKPKVYLLYLPSSTNCTIVTSRFPTDTVSKMLTIGSNSDLPVWVLDQHHYCYYSTDSSVFLTTFFSRRHGNGAHMGKDRIYPWMGWQLIAGPYVSIWYFCRVLKVHLPLSPEHLPYFVRTRT